jgi:hypothetical protein
VRRDLQTNLGMQPDKALLWFAIALAYSHEFGSSSQNVGPPLYKHLLIIVIFVIHIANIGELFDYLFCLGLADSLYELKHGKLKSPGLTQCASA